MKRFPHLAFSKRNARVSLALLAILIAAGGSCGREDAVELLDRSARAALGLRKFVDAEVAAERAVLLDPTYEDIRLQIRGAASFGRSVVSEAAAEMPGASLALFDVARRQTETARDAWRLALRLAPQSEEVRRNLERAVRRIDVLKEKKRLAEEARRAAPKRPKPVPSDGNKSAGTPQAKGTSEVSVEVATGDLPPEGARRVLERAMEKQREKRVARELRRESPSQGVERDW